MPKSPSFNEAGATKPRNSAVELAGRANPQCASMRPGRQSPGILILLRQYLPRLQRFNEAGATKPRNSAGRNRNAEPAGDASMRPGRQSPGILGRGSGPLGTRHASMRPGRQSPGIPSAPKVAPRSRTASMRPGRQSPGIRLSHRRTEHHHHRFNEAGATKPRNSSLAESRPSRRGWLQ